MIYDHEILTGPGQMQNMNHIFLWFNFSNCKKKNIIIFLLLLLVIYFFSQTHISVTSLAAPAIEAALPEQGGQPAPGQAPPGLWTPSVPRVPAELVKVIGALAITQWPHGGRG